MSLADARDKLREARKPGQELDPGVARKIKKTERRQTNANTFELVANEWFEINKMKWVFPIRSGYAHGWTKDLIPSLGPRPISLIRSPEMLDAIRKIEARDAPEMARRILQMARLIFHYGLVTAAAKSTQRSASARRCVHPRPSSLVPL